MSSERGLWTTVSFLAHLAGNTCESKQASLKIKINNKKKQQKNKTQTARSICRRDILTSCIVFVIMLADGKQLLDRCVVINPLQVAQQTRKSIESVKKKRTSTPSYAAARAFAATLDSIIREAL